MYIKLMTDSRNMLGSIRMIPRQIKEAVEAVGKIDFPADYKNVHNIVVAGMGGSALGAYVIKSLYGNQLIVPVEIINDYHLPAYVNAKTLVIVSTYSGSTEETLSCANECLEKNAKIIGITTGGQLESFLIKNKLPYYKIDPLSNPCGQPRIALGYSIFGQIAILKKIGLLAVDLPDTDNINTENAEKSAQEIVKKVKDKTICVIAAEHLAGNAHIAANQLNENAKIFACYSLLPDLNHHLLEGLQFPASNKTNLAFLFLTSPLYSEKLRQRVAITEDVIRQNGLRSYNFPLHGESRLSDVVETLLLTSFLSFYLAQANSVDPSPIPWVDYFKKKLSN